MRFFLLIFNNNLSWRNSRHNFAYVYNKSWKLIRRQKVSKIIQQDANALWQRRQHYNFPNLLSMTTTADSNSIHTP